MASGWIINRLLGNKDSDAIDRNGQGVDVAQLNLQKYGKQISKIRQSL